MIDGEQRGPFTLEELDAAGVRPGTYVWCKGMETWRKAGEVADICRYWRQRLSGTLPTQSGGESPQRTEPPVEDNIRSIHQLRSFDPAGPEPGTDIDRRPAGLMLPAFLSCLVCFPLTGAVAIYFAFRTSRLWAEAMAAEKQGDKNVRALKLEAHDAARSAKMWIGITFFIGVIAVAAAMLKVL